MFSSPGRPSSAPTPSSRPDYNETAPSRSRSPATDSGPTSAARASGTPPHTRSGTERRTRLGRPEGKGRHPRAHTPGSRLPPQAAQAGLAAWSADPQGQRQSFTWWAGASMTPGTGIHHHDLRDHRGQTILPITDGRGWPRRPALGAIHHPHGGSSAPPPSLTVTIPYLRTADLATCRTATDPGHPGAPGGILSPGPGRTNRMAVPTNGSQPAADGSVSSTGPREVALAPTPRAERGRIGSGHI